MSAATEILKQFDKAVAELADHNCNEASVKIDQPMLSTSWQNSYWIKLQRLTKQQLARRTSWRR